MDDSELLQRVAELIEEEHHLERSTTAPVPEETSARLDALAVELDRCWDLLRQRRARRHAGQDPDAAEVRPASVVEGYRQ